MNAFIGLVWVGLSVLIVFLFRRFELWTVKQMDRVPPNCARVRLFGAEFPAVTWLKYKLLYSGRVRILKFTPNWTEPRVGTLDMKPGWLVWPEKPSLAIPHVNWLEGLEILGIVVWAVWVGKAYLNFDPLVWPIGGEFSSSVQSNFIWSFLPKCGTCVFWNSTLHGGFPSFVDTHGFMLYPPAILATFLWGVLNGSKVMLIYSLALAGLAQWWLSKIIGLGRVARLWCALMAVVGGNLAARMELGAVGVVVSTATCCLVLPPLVGLGLTGRRRYTIWLGLTLGLVFLAGQGYMQVGLGLAVFPALVFFLFNRGDQARPIWKEYLLGVGLAVLIAGVFLVPLVHIYPNTYKEIDPSFRTAQSFAYVPLNLVINDLAFYRTSVLIPFSFPHLYMNYIGWVPVFLAITVLAFLRQLNKNLLAFFATAILLVFLTASADLLKTWSLLLPDFMAGVRHPSQIAGLAIPLVLGLSGLGLDRLLKLNWPILVLMKIAQEERQSLLSISTVVILTIPLLFASKSAYESSQVWLTTTRINYDSNIRSTLESLITDSSEWINPPFGEHFWSIPTLEAGMKMGLGITHWGLMNRIPPDLYYESVRGNLNAADQAQVAKKIEDISIMYHLGNEYAYVQTGDQKVPCKAKSLGGNIDVNCVTNQAGTLVVQENNLSGWAAERDLAWTALYAGNWLSVEAPAGTHDFHFRYQPWDVWVGLALTLIGLGLCGVLWNRDREKF